MKKDEISAPFETMVDPRRTLEDGLFIRIAGPGGKKAEKIRRGIELLAQSRRRMDLGSPLPGGNGWKGMMSSIAYRQIGSSNGAGSA